jgi:ComF family protein
MMQQVLDRLLSLLYPDSNRCFICGGVYSQASVCYNCIQSFSRVRPKVNLPPVDEVMALAFYRKEVRTALHRLKFLNSPALARKFALELVRIWGNEISQYQVVTSVPMHRSRYIQRGYNQAELLAREVAAAAGLPYRTYLSRVRPTDPQHNLSHSRRRQNVTGVFSPVLPFEYCQGVLLVDDILTTGSTVAGCARVLKESGMKQVGVLVVAFSEL